MVLLPRFLPTLYRPLGATAASTSSATFHGVGGATASVRATAAAVSSSASCKRGFTSRSAVAAHRSHYRHRGGPLGITTTTMGSGNSPWISRTLTTAREKVKVLLVLYDGHQHAKDVSQTKKDKKKKEKASFDFDAVLRSFPLLLLPFL